MGKIVSMYNFAFERRVSKDNIIDCMGTLLCRKTVIIKSLLWNNVKTNYVWKNSILVLFIRIPWEYPSQEHKIIWLVTVCFCIRPGKHATYSSSGFPWHVSFPLTCRVWTATCPLTPGWTESPSWIVFWLWPR